MEVDHPLYQAVLADPGDNDARLVCADWFEERGDTVRARFIRLQLELSNRPLDDTTSWTLRNEVVRLLHSNHRHWNAPLHRVLSRGPLKHEIKKRRGRVRTLAYRRGFVEKIDIDAECFARHGEILFQLAPIRDVRPLNLSGKVDHFFESAGIHRVRALDLHGLGDRYNYDLADHTLPAIFSHVQALKTLEVLDLSHTQVLSKSLGQQMMRIDPAKLSELRLFQCQFYSWPEGPNELLEHFGPCLRFSEFADIHQRFLETYRETHYGMDRVRRLQSLQQEWHARRRQMRRAYDCNCEEDWTSGMS